MIAAIDSSVAVPLNGAANPTPRRDVMEDNCENE